MNDNTTLSDSLKEWHEKEISGWLKIACLMRDFNKVKEHEPHCWISISYKTHRIPQMSTLPVCTCKNNTKIKKEGGDNVMPSDKLKVLSESQEKLGQEFQDIYHKNAWNMYES